MPILLKEWRRRRRLSLRQLALRARVAVSTLLRIEQGELSPTVDLLEKLAKALDVEVRRLFPRAWPVPTKRVRKRPDLRSISGRRTRGDEDE
jgi:transcriptional regulator with XRE-family HTH domain